MKLDRKTKILLTALKTEKWKSESDHKFLLHKYNLLKQYFQGTNTAQEAEMKYYSEQFQKSGYLEEGRFSLNYNSSLFDEMNKNKKQRKKLTQDITNLKKEIKKTHNNHTLALKRRKKIQQIIKNNGIQMEK